ncbi:MAG TPA: methyltransferase domain-containing protein [Amaricoccus sp.]|nr:methyltransferase domain-containing protein [Amaricoccus sp.]
MRFDEDTADRLEIVFRGPDIVAQRRHTLGLLAPEPGERVLDIGSGPGFLCEDIAGLVGPQGRVRGIDTSAVLVRRAAARNRLPWLDYVEADATALAEPDRGYDAIVSTQVAEYVPDTAAFCSEAFRVLRPGGRGVLLATDWDTVAWHSDDPARTRRVLDGFRPHCAHSALPRTFAPSLRAAGFDVLRVSCYPIVNTDGSEASYSRGSAALIAAYLRRAAALPEAEIAAWQAEFAALGEAGRYYFVTSRIFFKVRRPGGA